MGGGPIAPGWEDHFDGGDCWLSDEGDGVGVVPGDDPAEVDILRGIDKGAIVPKTGLEGLIPNGLFLSPLRSNGAGKVRSLARSFPFGVSDAAAAANCFDDAVVESNDGGGERRKSKLVSASLFKSPPLISIDAGLPIPPIPSTPLLRPSPCPLPPPS
jgi:hypothetical protein